MNKNHKKIYAWLWTGFMIPPVVWLTSGLFFEIWNLEEMLRILLSPYIWIYVIIVIGFVTFILGRNLNIIGNYLNNKNKVIKAQRAVQRTPWIFLLTMGVYCILGPNVALLGQTLQNPFLKRSINLSHK